jgi:hypothetical protein
MAVPARAVLLGRVMLISSCIDQNLYGVVPRPFDCLPRQALRINFGQRPKAGVQFRPLEGARPSPENALIIPVNHYHRALV